MTRLPSWKNYPWVLRITSPHQTIPISTVWNQIPVFVFRTYRSRVFPCLTDSALGASSRLLSHVALQEYLRGRYYLSPSRLYSCVRLSANKSSYDVPVEGDWVTIAVVAERGQVRSCRAAVGITPGDDDGAPDDAAKSKPNTCATQSWPPKAGGKKYVNMKLIDFGAARLRPSATAGKAGPSGDTFLSLLLFESDGFDELTEEDGRTRKIYHGGSKGAFEAMSKLKEGDVIALLNPRVLKPYKVISAVDRKAVD